MNSKVSNIRMGEEYSKIAALQKEYNVKAAKPIAEMINEMSKDHPEVFSSKEPFRVADLGCFDAVNSLPILVGIIDNIKKINPAKSIEIYLNDIPANDITKAINNVTMEVKIFDEVYIYGSAKSFYFPLFPQGSMDFIYSLTSVQMVSEQPPGIHPLWQYFSTPEIPPTEEGEIKWVELAKKDWQTFLILRESELRPHGRLYIGTHGLHDPGSIQEKYMVDIFSRQKKALRELLKKYGWEKYEQKLTMPSYFRRLEEFELPIKEKKTLLKLKKVEYHNHPDFPQMKFKSSEEEAVSLVKNMARLFSKVFQGALSEELRKEEFINEFVENYSKTYIDFLKSLKEDYISCSIGLHFGNQYFLSIN